MAEPFRSFAFLSFLSGLFAKIESLPLFCRDIECCRKADQRLQRKERGGVSACN